MNISENKIAMRKARRDKLIASYRNVVRRLNIIEDRLHVCGLTAKENDDLLTEYRNLSVKITHLEYELTYDFGINTENL